MMQVNTSADKYRLVLGLEIHIQTNSSEKMFCGCDANIWQAEPNTQTCPTCLGLPGALPVPNFESIQKTQLLGLALNCKLNENSHFDRKHYFYPDLPKGYQISQYKEPLCGEGYLELISGKKAVIERIHLEEDTAKSFHEGGKTLIDFNKSGISLMEIVTTPCFSNVTDAVDFCKKIQDIARVINVSDADMEKGNMRLEVNISLRTPDMEKRNEIPKYKVEVKNINSFRFMEKAVISEIKRQSELLNGGKTPVQENRGWDEKKQSTVLQREKEEAHDYRYFPEPDIPPMVFDDKYITDLKNKIPELPYQLKVRLIKEYGINTASADFFSTGQGIEFSRKFEEVAKEVHDCQKLANLLINKPEYRNKDAEDVTKVIVTGSDGVPTDGTDLNETVKNVLEKNQSAVQSYRSGKQGSLEFLVGQVIKSVGTGVNVSEIRKILMQEL